MHLPGWPGKAGSQEFLTRNNLRPISRFRRSEHIGRKAFGSEYASASIIATRNNQCVRNVRNWLSSLQRGMCRVECPPDEEYASYSVGLAPIRLCSDQLRCWECRTSSAGSVYLAGLTAGPSTQESERVGGCALIAGVMLDMYAGLLRFSRTVHAGDLGPIR